MRCVIAPDKFKGSLAAQSVAHSIAEGVLRVAPSAEIALTPMADGGEGTAEVIAAVKREARVQDVEVTGPLPSMRVVARIVFVDDGATAVLDMASAAGFSLVSDEQRDPTRTTTYGVGELIAHAARHGAQRVLVGLGGSATCDGGLGAAQALGARIELEEGPASKPFTGGDLARIRAVHLPAEPPTGGAQVICLCDVDNPLLGARGTARAFGPQKGATRRQVEQLERGLQHLVEITGAALSAEMPGAGAAGGLGFGLHLATGAALRSGSSVVADTVGLDATLAGADVCFTGEGRFDATSLGGKVTAAVARRCNAAQVPCFILAGAVEPKLVTAHDEGITSFTSILPGPMTVEQALPHAHQYVAFAAEQTMRIFFAGRGLLPEEMPIPRAM